MGRGMKRGGTNKWKTQPRGTGEKKGWDTLVYIIKRLLLTSVRRAAYFLKSL
jgi:hypothetical protein